jgi:hypothetical protein
LQYKNYLTTEKLIPMKKSLFVFAILMFVVATNSFAQHRNSSEYTTAIGVRFYPGAITFKQNFNHDNKLEAIAYFWNGKGTRITGLYEHYYEIEGLDGLQWYAGPGAHIMMNDDNEGQYSNKSYFGIDGVLGLDYKIKNIPLNLSLDWQPSFDFGGGNGFVGGFGGLGVRYVLR